MCHVFQYGSNCTTARLNGPNRLNNQAEDLGPAQTIEDFDIAFNVSSRTNGCAAADLVPTSGRKAWGVLYYLSVQSLEELKRVEGPRYKAKPIRVRNQAGEELVATTFLVKPEDRSNGLATNAAYVSWIVYGLRAHGVPEDYITHVLDVAITTNERATESASEQIRIIETL